MLNKKKKKMFSAESPAHNGQVDILNPGSRVEAPQSPSEGGRRSKMFKQMISFVAVAGLVLALAPATRAGLVGELSILDLTADPDGDGTEFAPGDNPGTGEPWALGDTYHFVFVTSTGTTATSSDIGDYNDTVQGCANATATYDIGVDEGVGWKVIGSTAIPAIDNTHTTYTDTEPGYPIFLLDGSTTVAFSYKDLWDDDDIRHEVNLTEVGGSPPTVNVWTGTVEDGSAHPLSLGSSPEVRAGNSNWNTGKKWINNEPRDPNDTASLYALSTTLHIVPEPATLALLALGLPFVMRRKRK